MIALFGIWLIVLMYMITIAQRVGLFDDGIEFIILTLVIIVVLSLFPCIVLLACFFLTKYNINGSIA